MVLDLYLLSEKHSPIMNFLLILSATPCFFMNSGLTVCLKEVAHGVYITIRWCIINSFQLEICLTIRIFKDLEILSHQTIATEFIQQNL